MKAWQKRLAVLPFVPDGVLAGSRQSWRPSQRIQRIFGGSSARRSRPDACAVHPFGKRNFGSAFSRAGHFRRRGIKKPGSLFFPRH